VKKKISLTSALCRKKRRKGGAQAWEKRVGGARKRREKNFLNAGRSRGEDGEGSKKSK